LGVAQQARQAFSGLHRADAVPDHAAHDGDAGIGPSEHLARVNGDRPLPDLRLVVAGHALPLLVAPLDAGLSEEIDLVEPDLAAVALAAEIERIVEMPPADDLAAGVVGRHGPFADADPRKEFFAVGVLVDVGRLREVRHDDLGGPRPDILA